MTTTGHQEEAFTRIELAVLLGVIALLSTCLLPGLARTRSDAHRLTCSDNLRKAGLAFRSWSLDHGGLMPMQWLSGAAGGAGPEVGTRTVHNSQTIRRGVFKMFLCLSNQLVTP